MTDGGYTKDQAVAMHAERRRERLITLVDQIVGAAATPLIAVAILDDFISKTAQTLTDLHDIELADLTAANTREVERRREAESIVRDLAEWHQRASTDDGDDFLNGDAGDGRHGHNELDALGERAIGMVAETEGTKP